MFKLTDYEDSIKAIATKHKVDPARATDMFILNLTVMKPQFDGANPDVDFRRLGQKWNNLISSERIKQRATVVSDLTKTTKRMNMMD